MKITIAYWFSTGLISLLYFASAAFYLTNHDSVVSQLADLGYPAYLATLLPAVKILGPLAILVRKWIALSDLAYAGIFYHLILAASAHINAGDQGYIPAILGLILLCISFFTQNAVRKGASPYAGSKFGKTSG